MALLKLESLGYLKLPERLIDRGGQPPRVSVNIVNKITLEKVTTMPTNLEARLVCMRYDSQKWNALIGTYHYLGLATPVGRLIRYLIYGDDRLLGAISFSDSAWALIARDRLLANLGFERAATRDSVMCNNRFLILPSVRVPNLASRALSLSLRQARLDWKDRFQCVPILAETFVDQTLYAGSCYLAANWVCIGMTRGFAKRGAKHINRAAPKMLMVHGLTPSIQRDIIAQYRGAERRAA